MLFGDSVIRHKALYCHGRQQCKHYVSTLSWHHINTTRHYASLDLILHYIYRNGFGPAQNTQTLHIVFGPMLQPENCFLMKNIYKLELLLLTLYFVSGKTGKIFPETRLQAETICSNRYDSIESSQGSSVGIKQYCCFGLVLLSYFPFDVSDCLYYKLSKFHYRYYGPKDTQQG